ncbi:MAG: DNA double-strand break repair nuclease NurA [bacterium]
MNINNSNRQKNNNKLILHPSFEEMVDEIKKINLTINRPPQEIDFDFSHAVFPPKGKLQNIEDFNKYNLSPNNGQKIASKYDFSGYDESKLNYLALEGDASFTAHSIVVASREDYIPINYLTFYFYTKSKLLKNQHPLLKQTNDSISEANFDYVSDRNDLLSKWTLEGSILFIDGPLIGGNITSYTLDMVDKLHNKNIIPIFIIKNSDSNLVIDNLEILKHKYNSDLHWAFNYLKTGQRTSFFLYRDEYNSRNAKVFCYIKTFNNSPHRVEFHIDTYGKYNKEIDNIMDLIYFLYLVQGDNKNPQLRPIAVAEKFARELLHLTDSYNLIKSSGLIPTMNQQRFGG